MAIKKIEIQDSTGDVYHPHTTTDVVFHGDTKLFDLLAKFLKKDGSVPVESTLNPLNSNQIALGSTNKSWRDIYLGSATLNVNNGTCKLPNGYILQYGRVSLAFNNSITAGLTINYPTTFPNGVAVVGGNLGEGFSSAAAFNIAVSISSRSQIDIRGCCITGATTQTRAVNWWAIGW